MTILVRAAGLTALLALLSCTGPTNPDGVLFHILPYAGTSDSGWSGDRGPAKTARLNNPVSVVFDGSGNLYVSDWGNNVVRRIDPGDTITTIAGTGSPGYSGDGGKAPEAELNHPNAIACDEFGGLYISDWGNNVIRKIDVHGFISTVAGCGLYGYSGDGGPATLARLSWPTGVAVRAGSLFISDSNNHVIRRVDPSGAISTFAGTGSAGYTGDGGKAFDARLDSPSSLLFDHEGNLLISDYNNNVIRRVATGIITTLAGNGAGGYGGDGGPAEEASLSLPGELAENALGELFVADTGNNRIRRVSTSRIISTVAGNGTSAFSGNDLPAVLASLNAPSGIAADSLGNLYIADSGNNCVREVFLASVAQRRHTASEQGPGGDLMPAGGPEKGASE